MRLIVVMIDEKEILLKRFSQYARYVSTDISISLTDYFFKNGSVVVDKVQVLDTILSSKEYKRGDHFLFTMFEGGFIFSPFVG